MNYPNLPNSALEITEQPQVKEITNELLKQLQNALKSNSLFTEQVELSLKGIVRILEVLLSLDFFKNANEIDSSLRNSIEWLTHAGESLKAKMREYESFFNAFNVSMHANEQEVTNTLNANTENIKSEVKKLENQIIEATTRLLTSYQIFLNQARDNANNQITENKTASLEALNQAKTNANNEINTNKTQVLNNLNEAKENANNEINNNKTQALNNINEAKESATNQINANKQEVLNNITQEKQQATSEITEAKKTAFNELLETLKPKFSGLFVGAYYIRNVIYIQGGWEQKIKDLSDYALEKSKKYEIEVFFNMGMRFLTEDLYRRSTTRKNPSVPNNGSGFDAGTSLNNFNNYTAVYASDEINFNNGMLTITPGLRYTFLNYVKKDAPPFKEDQTGKTTKERYNQWNPAVNVGYKPIKDWLFYFNYQRSYIPPQFSNIGSFVGTSTDYFQIFNVMEGGSRYYFNNQVSFNANYFVIFANHYFTGRYGDNREPVNARSQGVELELYYTPIRGLNFHAAYTFIDANITSHTMVTNPANPKGPKKDIFGKKLPFVSPHQFILDASYTYAKTTIGLSSFFYSRTYSDVLNTVPFTEYVPTIKNGAITTKTAGMTPWYWVWNLQISSTLWERKNQSVNASLQVNNIFNMKYWFSGIGTSPNGKEAAPPRSITAYVSYHF